MYTIVKLMNGKYYCMFRLQDGTERFYEDTLDAAVKHAKNFAKVCNGTKITRKDITFLIEKEKYDTEWVPWDGK